MEEVRAYSPTGRAAENRSRSSRVEIESRAESWRREAIGELITTLIYQRHNSSCHQDVNNSFKKRFLGSRKAGKIRGCWVVTSEGCATQTFPRWSKDCVTNACSHSLTHSSSDFKRGRGLLLLNSFLPEREAACGGSLKAEWGHALDTTISQPLV